MTQRARRRWWQFEVERPDVSDVRTSDEGVLDRAWLRLLINHMAVHSDADDGCSCLRDSIKHLEEIFMREPSLAWYHKATYLNGVESVPEPAVIVDERVRHVALLQAQFMEQAFQHLKLGRYANAPGNRGWMNLFRRWGSSTTFNMIFDEFRKVFTREFVAFYDNYVRFYHSTIDVKPVRHPWDPPLMLQRVPPALDADEVEELRILLSTGIRLAKDEQSIPGVFLDSGLVETIVDEDAKTDPMSGAEHQAAPDINAD